MPAVDEPELADLDPFALMAAEAAGIDTFYTGLDGDGWRLPTRCAGWDRRDLLAHLAGVEDYTAAGLRGEVRQLYARAGTGDLDGFNRWGIDRRAGLRPAALLAEWRKLVEENDAALRERGPRVTLDTSVGAYPVGRQAFYLASERAIHADDAGVPVPTPQREARLDWRLRFARAAVIESRRDREPVVLVSDRGAQVVRFGDLEARLPDEQFVEAASGRLSTSADLPGRLRDILAVLS